MRKVEVLRETNLARGNECCIISKRNSRSLQKQIEKISPKCVFVYYEEDARAISWIYPELVVFYGAQGLQNVLKSTKDTLDVFVSSEQDMNFLEECIAI